MRRLLPHLPGACHQDRSNNASRAIKSRYGAEVTEFLHFWIQSSEFNYADENIAHCSCGHRGEEPEYDGRETAALLQRVRHKLELETNLREI